MNNVEKTITKAQLKLEQRALKELKKSYEKAKHDIEIQISALNSRKDMQNLQSIIYQKKYQEILLKQIEGVIDDLNKGQYETLQDFFEGAYATGYIGSMYDLHNQGIPLVIPIDPKKMVTAVMTDSKLSKNYYQNKVLPENLSTLKRNIRQELTRGIASGKTWIEVAYQVAQNMNSPFNRAMRDAMRIVRTEGHRINQQGFLDASHEAKDKGADIVKQWDSTLDGNTRPAHRIADGQIKELDEPFIVDGEKMDAPSIGGSARNVCNCRCQLLQRARWSLDEDELKTLQDRASFFGLDKSQDFDNFKQKYLKLPSNADTVKIEKHELTESTKKVINLLQKEGVKYRKVELHSEFMSEEQIIKVIGGGDRTSGSCASLAMCYLGQKKGLNVLDFRGGKSMDFFASKANKKLFFSQFTDIYHSVMAKNTARAGTEALKLVESGKEYLLGVGRHMAVVRRTDAGVLQYLELQSVHNNGWHDFTSNPRQTLINRFGCSGKGWRGLEVYEAQLTNIDNFNSVHDLKEVLGYINTASDEQKKGVGGHER